MKKHKLKARSPAKLILSGEHAVVYGYPAIAVAVDRYAESCISSQMLPRIFFNFLNLDYAKSFTLQALTLVKHRLHEQYHAFLAGQCNIRDVLKMPFELLQFAVCNLLEKLNIDLPHGLEIHTSSNIPMGCGMGSSAAVVMSMLYALVHFLKLEIDPARFLTLGKEAENLQHGRSSGLDLQLALQGGCLKYKEGQIKKQPSFDCPLTIIQTGTPLTSTGQCITKAAHYFQDKRLGEDFAQLTESLERALEHKNWLHVMHCVRENHRLLAKIQVVPEKVANFIHAIEKRGYAAKVCGAGASEGDNAGILWLMSEDNHIDQSRIQDLLVAYDYQSQTVLSDNHGTRLV